MTPSPVTEAKEVGAERDAIQKIVVDWGARCFGDDHMRDKIIRAARFIEEAAELVQAVGLSKAHAMRALDYVYSREPGDPAQELGGVSNTQYALAGALGLSVADCEAREIARCLAKTPEHFAQRNRDKIEKIDRTAPATSAPAGYIGEVELAEMSDKADEAIERMKARLPVELKAPAGDEAGKLAVDQILNMVLNRKTEPGTYRERAERIVAALLRSQPPQPTGQQRDPKECFSAFTAIKNAMQPTGDVGELVAELQQARRLIGANGKADPSSALMLAQLKLDKASNFLLAINSRLAALDHECQASMAEIAEGRRRAEAAEARVAELEKALLDEVPGNFVQEFMAHRHFHAAKDIDILTRKDGKEYRLEADWLKPFIIALAALSPNSRSQGLVKLLEDDSYIRMRADYAKGHKSWANMIAEREAEAGFARAEEKR